MCVRAVRCLTQRHVALRHTCNSVGVLLGGPIAAIGMFVFDPCILQIGVAAKTRLHAKGSIVLASFLVVTFAATRAAMSPHASSPMRFGDLLQLLIPLGWCIAGIAAHLLFARDISCKAGQLCLDSQRTTQAMCARVLHAAVRLDQPSGGMTHCLA